MFEIDGAKKSGSGTILRLSVTFSSVTKKPLHIYNIRQNRPKPGLKPQHLEAVKAAAKICEAQVDGATLYSKEMWFSPKEVRGGDFKATIGTAGSIPMLLMTVMPICTFAKERVTLHVTKGGTDVLHAPTINYMKHVFQVLLKRLGFDSSIVTKKYGYYPKGNGSATLTTKPPSKLRPIIQEDFGRVESIKGVSVCTFLAKKKVAERQAKSAQKYLLRKGFKADIEIVNDTSNPLQKGSSIVLWARTNTGVILGSDAIGEERKTSETVGRTAAKKLLDEISVASTVDIHSADMLIPYLAFTEKRSVFLTRAFSDHLKTNIWLAEKMLDVRFRIRNTNGLYKIEKLS